MAYTARVGARASVEVAVLTGPDATGLPVVGDEEGALGVGSSLPTRLDGGYSVVNVQVSEDCRPVVR